MLCLLPQKRNKSNTAGICAAVMCERHKLELQSASILLSLLRAAVDTTIERVHKQNSPHSLGYYVMVRKGLQQSTENFEMQKDT